MDGLMDSVLSTSPPLKMCLQGVQKNEVCF